MKKYLSLAVVLGALAFISVSFLAQAEPETSKVETVVEQAVEADAAMPEMAAEAVAPEVETFMKDAEDCEASVAVANEGKEVAPEAHDSAFISCMTAKGYSEEDVKGRYLDHQTIEDATEETTETMDVTE